jgi:Family of unknown function (DUF6062)
VFFNKIQRQPGVAYYELRDALREDGCPICSLLVRRSLAALDSLLYEQVTDPDSRDELRRSHGLCNWHAWALLQVPTGRSGIAIIYETLLGYQLKELLLLQQTLRPRTLWQRFTPRVFHHPVALPFLSRWQTKAPCPMCRQHTRMDEGSYLRTLLDGLSTPEFAAHFQDSFGLCLPHLRLAIEREPAHAALPTLVHLQVQKLTALRSRLQEIMRKFDYRFAAELRGEEGAEWRRVIELFVGKPAVFGNERHGQI